ncbi:MAG: hypothetical protein IPM69_14470 [Ignavibacteria bacterium]|nr:hypothetical protein [Ignavibacteria bacterium]
MKHIGILIALTLLCIGCNRSNEEEMRVAIKGDWISDESKDRSWTAMLSFEDSVCSIFDRYGLYANFTIYKDTVFIREKLIERKKTDQDYLEDNQWASGEQLVRDGSIFLKFRLMSVLNNQLIVLLSESDTLKLHKLPMKHNLPFERIGFYCSTGMRREPELYLELDRAGNFLFNGRYYTDKRGLYRGKVSVNDISIINNKVKSINLDELKVVYDAIRTDYRTFGIVIQAGGKTYRGVVEYDFSMPADLHFLFHKLQELYRNIDLQRDSTVKASFQLESITPKIQPPPEPQIKGDSGKLQQLDSILLISN